jgi:hypothetical protein
MANWQAARNLSQKLVILNKCKKKIVKFLAILILQQHVLIAARCVNPGLGTLLKGCQLLQETPLFCTI